MYSEYMYSVLNCHNGEKHTEFCLEWLCFSDYQFPETHVALTVVDFELSSPQV
jgi:hypothetical protein